ncbi:MAG: polysaccharide deacetylase family protein [Thermodesulfobacteriota bacterium]
MGFVSLVLHQVQAGFDDDGIYVMPAAALAQLLDKAVARGCAVRSMVEARQEPTAGRVLALTFDDGFQSDYSLAAPLMLDRGQSATFFITTSFVGTAGYVGWPAVRELAALGFEVASHSHGHPFLSRLPTAALLADLRESRQRLEDAISRPVPGLALPFGDGSRRVFDAAWRAGYQYVATSMPGRNRPGQRVLGRISVHRRFPGGLLDAILDGRTWPLWRLGAEYRLKALIKACVGFDNYRRLRRRIAEYY